MIFLTIPAYSSKFVELLRAKIRKVIGSASLVSEFAITNPVTVFNHLTIWIHYALRIFSASVCLFVLQSAHGQSAVSVLTQHNNIQRTGWNNEETVLDHSSVSSSGFGLIGTLGVDDQLYAQPLVVRNVNTGNYTGSVLYVATVNNTVYAFNGDDPSQNAPLWQSNLSPAGQRAPNIFDLKDPVEGSPCGGYYRDFSGRFGIVGTPVIDTLTYILYVATKTVDSNGVFRAYINALDIRTGQPKAGSPQLMQAQVGGTGTASVNGKISYGAKYQNQRPALLLYNNIVYVASASYCDWGPYHGWILGYDASTLTLSYSYNATPNGWEAGIWMAGQGISVGEDGNLYAVTGNGESNPDNISLIGGRGESLIKLSPQLGLLDWFMPSNYTYLDQNDLDYGSDGVLIVPNSTLTISGSKEGISYVVDYNSMKRYNPTNSQVIDTLEFNPQRLGDVHVHGSPVYAKFSTGEFVYAWSESFKMRKFMLDRSANRFSNNFEQGNRNLDNGMPGAMLSISSNQDDTASAIVWACFPSSGNANNQTRPGTIAAYRANDITGDPIWSSDRMAGDVLGSFAKFNSPTIANGKVYAPTFSNAVKIYGLNCGGALTGLVYGNGNGLKGEYFSNSSSGSGFSSPSTLVQLDQNINFNWGTSSPAQGISVDMFKIRWSGQLLPLTDDVYTIYLIASDGVRMWINDSLLVDSWADKTVTTTSTTIPLQKSKTYNISIEYYSNTNPATCILQWSATGICRQNIPTSQLFTIPEVCSSDGTGLHAEYFSNTQPGAPFPSAPTVFQIEPTINFNWGAGSPTGISHDLFKARFTGYIQSLDSGTYTFYATADDGIKVWINNQLLIDEWIDQAATEYSATVTLGACAKNSIRIEYYENGGDAVCKLEWSGPLFSRQAIPTAQLFTDHGPLPDNKEFLVYPNPNYSHQVTVAVNSGFQKGDEIRIYNMLGQLVNSTTVTEDYPGQTIKLPIILSAGMYVVRARTQIKKYWTKLLVF